MNSKYTNIDDDNPTIVIKNARNNGRIDSGSVMQYPNDNFSMPAHTRIVVQNYNRQNPASIPTTTPVATIYLPLPQQLVDSSSINSDGVELGPIGGIVVDAASIPLTGTLDETFNAGISSLRDAYNNAGISRDAISTILQTVYPNSTDLGLGAASGAIPNPHTTALFKGVNLRQYNFAWKFSPRTPEESRQLRNIIRTLQRAQKPARGNREFIMDYPQECLVFFTPDIMSVNRSFIKNLTVNYSSAGQPAFYEDLSPTDIELAIEFIEMEAITREMVQF